VLDDQGRSDDALAIYDRALSIDRAQLAASDLRASGAMLGRADALFHLGRLDEAARGYDEVIAIYDASSATSINLASTLYSRGDLLLNRGRCDAAIRDFARSVTMLEQLYGPTSGKLIDPLVGEAHCLIRAGHPGDAIARLERALRLPGDPGDALQIARARALLGRAQVETGRDVPGGLAMIRAARPRLAGSVKAAETVRELDAWLSARGK
jgi:tetratricopeptide (TPR) repeat protein